MFKFWILNLPIIFSLTYENSNVHLSFEEQILTHLFCICGFLYPFICKLFYNWLLLLRPTYLKWDTVMDYNLPSMQVSMALQHFKQSLMRFSASFGRGCQPSPQLLSTDLKQVCSAKPVERQWRRWRPPCLPLLRHVMPPVHTHRVDNSPFELKLLNWSLGGPKLLHLYSALLGLRHGNMANISSKMESNFNLKIHFLSKLLTHNLELSAKNADLLTNSSSYLMEHLFNVLALI